MRRDDARRLAREILRQIERKERSGTAGFLSYKLLRRLVVHAQLVGIRLEQYVTGPWTVGTAEPTLWSRFGEIVLPTVERGGFRLPVPDAAEAHSLAGFLNWCDAPEPQAG
ncbi:MAG TPA: hypothetical protein VFS40_00310 [Gemmatimonadales bacterium]|nr:hypothetical protein [Gemmatimonadales bacterium]